MKNNNQVIINKVKRLLRLAADNPDGDEGQNAFLHAQKLMIKYRIESHDVEDNVVGEDLGEISPEAITVYKKLYWWEKELAEIIARNFRVKIFYSSRRTGDQVQRKTCIKFYGFGQDLELAKEMYVLAYDAIVVRANMYVSKQRRLGDTNSGTRTLKKNYMAGFIDGLGKRFNEQISQLKGKYELLVQPPKEVEDAFTEFSTTFGKMLLNLPQIDDAEAYIQGHTDGKSIDLTRSSIDSNRL